ncbi:OmpA family protein [Pseudomonas hygromyciniae]|uniref:OmpA family protein n=1 Tax=Pseudomonas hygromyciniae TaxID=2812000 RepID=A0ABX7K0I2_9PSED|nr:OmpA family protein [Pseudomonas hygromyciniae]MBN0980106.1 OmpA family protein [Pseudomonas hygromyciniae]QSB40935.1 OmpA family protein [Pseudomonas hygromyciniae]
MLSNKSLALALCLTITGCAQTPQNDASGEHWWSFGFDKSASKDVTAKADAKAADAKADLKADLKAATPAPAAAAAPVVAKAESDTKWWWPFESKPKPLNKVDVTNIPMPDPKITQAWLDDYEPRLRAAIKDSNLQLERRDNVLVVIAPVDGSYNPKRPAMLLPVTLGPFTRVAKAVEKDPKTAVLVLGHIDTVQNQPLTKERAQSIASIFSLSGLKQDRLMLRGMGDLMPRAANDSTQGRALNRRMEIMFTQRTTMLALLSKYNSPNPPKPELVAVQDVVAPAPVAKKAVAAKKAPAKKAAAKPAAKKAAAKPAAKKPVAAKAAAPAKKVAANDQAKN